MLRCNSRAAICRRRRRNVEKPRVDKLRGARSKCLSALINFGGLGRNRTTDTRIFKGHPRAQRYIFHTQQSTKSSTYNAVKRNQPQPLALDTCRVCQRIARISALQLRDQKSVASGGPSCGDCAGTSAAVRLTEGIKPSDTTLRCPFLTRPFRRVL